MVAVMNDSLTRGVDLVELPVIADRMVPCPLVGREIEEGYCLDVNLQRLGYFQSDVLLEVQLDTGLSVTKVSAFCKSCPHQPLQKAPIVL